MKKYLLLLALFLAPALASNSGIGSTHPYHTMPRADWYYFHPQSTTSDGLITIAETVVDENILLDQKTAECVHVDFDVLFVRIWSDLLKCKQTSKREL